MRGWATAILAAGVLAAAALVAAGCDSKPNAAPPPPTTTTTTTNAASAATLKPRPGLLTSGSCEQLYELARAFSAALGGDSGDLVKTTAMLTDFAGETPSDIRPDFRVLANAYTRILGALAGKGYSASATPSRALVARLNKVSNQLDMVRVGTATTNVSAWAARNCRNYGDTQR
jgi:hypothetical protein